jgi:hypothetical protein
MKTIWVLFVFATIVFTARAEGTKQLMPINTGKCYVQFNETIGGQRQFALSTNTDTAHRLYIHIANAGEIINVGFKTLTGSSDAQYRIKDPSGNVVSGFTTIPTASPGFISTYNQASIGPNTLTGGTGGYTPITYTTLTTGDYYIEFEKTANLTSRFLFEFFDITVSSSSNNAITGRVWSYAWDLNTNDYGNSAYPVFYVYSNDKYITSINLNGMQPYSFVIACNNTGSQNTGNLFTDRQSVDGSNTVVPKYKIFLNTPDPNVYDIAVIPSMVENLRINGTPTTSQPVEFYVNMTKAGTIEIFLDIDGVTGYQSGGRDVVLVQQISAGGDIILWDCKDGLGNAVTSTITVTVASKFATGVTHLPVYDAEKNSNGFLVTRVAPNGPTNLVLYWDDSQITHNTIPVNQVITMLSGNTIADGHIWSTDTHNANGFGDGHTINSWWNGYEIDNLSSFDFIILPIELIQWNAIQKGAFIQLSWTTATETNNHFFNLQRSINGEDWTTISTILGAGNSSKNIYYNEIDEDPIIGISYYRLQQIDFDGKFTNSSIISVESNSLLNKNILVYSVQGLSYINIEQNKIKTQDISIIDINGKMVTNYVQMIQLNNSEVKINVSDLPKGTYFVKTKNYCRRFYL